MSRIVRYGSKEKKEKEKKENVELAQVIGREIFSERTKQISGGVRGSG